MRPTAYVATRARKNKGEDQGSGRNGRFINKRTNGQISRFGLRMADFILSRLRSSSVAKPSHFYQGLAEWQLYQGRPAAVAVYQSRRQPMAVLSTMAALSRLRTKPVAAMAVISFSGRFHIVPHKQFINGQVNLFRKSWQSEWPLYQSGQPHSSFASSAAP